MRAGGDSDAGIVAALIFTVTIGCGRGRAATAPPAPASDAGAPAARLENELKLRVPQARVEEVWSYLQRRYLARSWTAQGRRLAAKQADERFRDRYFDTADLRLLKAASGVRHRARRIPGDHRNKKDGRELVQVKLDAGDPLTREELKFPVRKPLLGAAQPPSALLALVPRKHHGDLEQVLAKAGVSPEALRPVLTLDQRRRRVYVDDAEGPIATVTLDEGVARRGQRSRTFAEVEIEIDEVRYTAASAAARQSMQRLTAEIGADLQRRFPDIRFDQTPKYNKAFQALAQPAEPTPRVLGRRSLAGAR